MKTRSESTIKTVCPFCSFGCEFGVVFDDFGIKGVEYLKQGSSEGRLCPRGSAAALYLNHPKRLAVPMRNGTATTWKTMGEELRKIFEHPERIAVTFDRNLTLEEYGVLVGFCKDMAIENTASTYCEPEAFLSAFFDTPFSLDQIDNATMIIAIGDLFNQAPMISKSLIGWKLGNRQHRLVVIDSYATHTSAFASDFLRVVPGSEPLLLLALANERLKGTDVPSVTGISESKILEITKSFHEAGKGIIFVSLPFGHTYDPVLVAESCARLSSSSGARVVPLVEFVAHQGNQRLGTILDGIKTKKIHYLINFGELFPYYYPQLEKSTSGATVYATSTLKHSGHTMLPAALNLEKQGSIMTNFGVKAMSGSIEPASGAKTIPEMLSLVRAVSHTAGVRMPRTTVDIQSRVEKLAARLKESVRKNTFTLIGEKIAYNFLGFFEHEIVTMNTEDAEARGIKANDTVTISSHFGTIDCAVKITRDVARGIIAIPAETPETRRLFDFEMDNGDITFIPTEVELWRRE